MYSHIKNWDDMDASFEDVRMNDMEYYSYMSAMSIGDVLRALVNDIFIWNIVINQDDMINKVNRTIDFLSRQNRFGKQYADKYGKTALRDIIMLLRSVLEKKNVHVLAFVY